MIREALMEEGLKKGLEQGLEQGRLEAAEILRETILESISSNSSMPTEQHETVKENLEKISDLATLKELITLSFKDSREIPKDS